MHPWVAVLATSALVARAWWKNSLTPGGLVAATITAAAHAYHPWNLPFALLVVFFLAGTRATHAKEHFKATLTMRATGNSGGEGPRNHIQVLANSAVASVLSVLHANQLYSRSAEFVDTSTPNPQGSVCYSWGGDVLLVGIIANYAAVAADTFSSELGILSTGEPRLITSLTLRKVPRGTNGGVSLTGLVAGLFGSMIIVTAAVLFTPFCTDTTAPTLGGGLPWTMEQRRTFMAFLVLWGLLGSVLDSILGAVFQRSVRDVRSGKIVEGEGGNRVLVTPGGQASQVGDAAHAKKHDGEKASRAVVSGWDLLDNNDVNFLMALTMSLGAMGVASWAWNISPSEILAI